MRWQRALWTFGLLYVLTGVLGSMTFRLPGINIVLTALLVGLASSIYFWRAPSGWQEGLRLGVFYLLAAAVLDGTVLLILALTDPSQLSVVTKAYTSLVFWVNIAELFIVSALVGFTAKKLIG